MRRNQNDAQGDERFSLHWMCLSHSTILKSEQHQNVRFSLDSRMQLICSKEKNSSPGSISRCMVSLFSEGKNGNMNRMDFKLKSLFRTLSATVWICLLIPAVMIGAEKKATNSAKLDEVLGRSADWKIMPEDYVVTGKAGEITLSGPTRLTLDGATSKSAPWEYFLSCRLKATTGNAASVNMQMACADRADKTQQFLAFSVSADSALNQAGYGMTVQGGNVPPPVTGILYFLAVSERSLTWSDEMRQSIEAQIATAPQGCGDVDDDSVHCGKRSFSWLAQWEVCWGNQSGFEHGSIRSDEDSAFAGCGVGIGAREIVGD